MGLYLAIVLLAESIPLQAYSPGAAEIVATYAGTAIGLAIAHVFAFTLSARLLSGGHVRPGAWRSAGAQLIAAALVALIATLPFLLDDEEVAFDVSGAILALFIGASGFESSRVRGASVRRSLGAGAVVLLIAAVVVVLKAALTH